ncbi:nitrilase-related carbon-nitrogen hydrolase [Sphingomonas sp. C3-2]|uniref:nitrilase-related carbon-nitrogen hydrolase n=1 Tax=Sphingomonas sp. C3-2 TaxID=3062169 RepID=UPI00294B1782|nr:nitrilase-related carbon-nitrogen hydrolase [Sphingomonas sp. C3-2]WOK37946.1 nitrilase-related carbon-nitrogen hydrolase [Sphingomonas sp. C3-2]
MTAIKPFAAVALQIAARSVERLSDRAEVSAQMLAMIDEIGVKIRASGVFIQQYGGSPLRLVVLPEYFLTSYPGRISIPDFAEKAALDMDGPEYEAMGRIAQAQNLFLAGNAYERDPNFPGIYFQTCFVIGPSGDIVLRYRRLNSMFAPTPHDVWSQYLDVYGLEGVFPVARTEIGNIAAIASEEILYPEIARAHALRGAEIFVHSSSEIGSPLATPKQIAKRARAFENIAYVVSANTAGIEGSAMPLASADGNSVVIDYKGNPLAESNTGETFTAFADLDINALRTQRRKCGMTNFLARQRLELFAPVYAGQSPQPANSLIENGELKIPDRDHFLRVQEQVIERLAKDGVI